MAVANGTTAHVMSQTVIGLAVIGCVTVLGLQGTLDASAVTGILGAVVGIVGGVGAVRVGSGLTNGAEEHKNSPKSVA